MTVDNQIVGRRVHELIHRRAEGILSRRGFLKAATGLGLSLPLATMLESRGAFALQDSEAGELNIVMQRVLVSLDPHGAQSVEEPTAVIASHIFGTLVTRNFETGDLEGSLATSWEAVDDVTWQFTLREGVMWQDGTPFTSADVKFSLERVLELEGPLAPLWALVTSVEAPDDLTITITTSEPQGTVPTNASLFYVTPAALSNEEGFFDAPVGLGPYQFSSWTRDSQIELVASDSYFGDPASVGTLRFREIPEVAAKVTAIETGEIDFTWGLPADQLPALRENADLTIDATPSYAYYFNWFNSSREPFTDVRVRQAMNYAIDRETLAADLLQDVGVVASAPIPSTIFGHAPQTPYAYDPERAMSLLAEAGLEDGFDTHVIWVPGSGPQDRELILSFISYWAAIGVNVESREMEQAAWLEDLLALEWDMDFQTNTVRTGDADFTLRRLYTTSANRNGYGNEELDEILVSAAASPDQAERAELYARACQIIWDDAVGVFPFDLTTNYIYNTRIQNFEAVPNTIPIFANVTLAE
ncbi:MAG: ABC transporter substrate-binding protein [Thermomicrobiales bacterium]